MIEFELKRAESRLAEHRAKLADFDRNIQDKERDKRDEYFALKVEETAKFKRLNQKQDKVLFVAFYILLNLAEDLNVERKMIKKDIIRYLVGIKASLLFFRGRSYLFCL